MAGGWATTWWPSEPLTQETLDAFLHRIPGEPADIAATGIDEMDLMGMLMKLIYRDRLETTRQFVEAIKLPYHIVLDLVRMAVDRQLLQTLGSRYSDNPIDLSYSFTEEGRRWTLDALQRLRYTGPAPVTLEEFNDTGEPAEADQRTDHVRAHSRGHRRTDL